jgi:hypothetical protein
VVISLALWTRRCRSSARSGRGRRAVKQLAQPTAQALAVALAATSPRESPVPGLGLGTWDQTVPFQCRMSVCELGVRSAPTAQASVADRAVTPFSLSIAEPGLGLGTWDQAVPFQRRVSVWQAETGTLQYCPTVQASAGESALTPFGK